MDTTNTKELTMATKRTDSQRAEWLLVDSMMNETTDEAMLAVLFDLRDGEGLAGYLRSIGYSVPQAIELAMLPLRGKTWNVATQSFTP